MKKKLIVAVKLLVIFYQIIISLSIAKVLNKKPTVTKIKNFTNQKNIFLFVGFCKEFDWSTINILTEAKSLGMYIVYVNNCDLFDLKKINKNIVDVYINNHNVGWDFSLYKTGTNYINTQLSNKNFDTVIYANDSVFYLKNGLRKFIKKFIESDSEIVGSFENSGHGTYHISSWFLGIKKSVFLNKNYLKFYKNIFDIKNKYYSIHFAEHKLTKLLLKMKCDIDVIYSNGYLLELVKNNFYTKDFIRIFDSLPFRDFMAQQKFTSDITLKNYINWLKLNLWLCSPMHVFGIYLISFKNFPVLKKDLYWTRWHHEYSSVDFVCETIKKFESSHAAKACKLYYLTRGRLVDASLIKKLQTYFGLRA
jgi:hypothetical protein